MAMPVDVWRKSSKSGDNGACVEVRNTGTEVQVRDTKDRNGRTLTFSSDAWTAFTEGVKADEFGL